MRLPVPAAREPLHHREVDCRGYRRDDGLWDIEGHLVDTKSYRFENSYRGAIEPGEPLHDMWVRLTLDDDLTVVEAVAATAAGPFGSCPAIAPAFRSWKVCASDPAGAAPCRAAWAACRGARIWSNCWGLWRPPPTRPSTAGGPGASRSSMTIVRHDISIPATRWRATATWCASIGRNGTRAVARVPMIRGRTTGARPLRQVSAL